MMSTLCCRGLKLVLGAALVAFLTQGEARAAFMVTVNGSVVAIDGGAGDLNPTGHEVTFAGTVNGYKIQLQARSQSGGGSGGGSGSSGYRAGIDLLDLQVIGDNPTGPLTITLSDTYSLPGSGLGTYDLVSQLNRDSTPGYSTSGTVSLATTATSGSGSGGGSTPDVSLSPGQSSGTSSGSFPSTSNDYNLGQTVVVDGLGNGDGVQVSGGSVVHAPAPASAVLLLSGAPFLMMFRQFRRGQNRSVQPVI
ncbi:hypothetical protein VT84_02700 [Gemmata sp. SH-PL17]|nr:hypothetical protein VT84_02700 [Gemmata sp. SH-PL17]